MKRLAFFGCSFTSGHELRDHEILGIPFEECNKLKRNKTIGQFDDLLNKKLIEKNSGESSSFETEFGNRLKLDQHNRKFSYAAKIADLLAIPYNNYALPGSGLEQIYLSMRLLDQQNKIDPDSDILFVGLTTIGRIVLLESNNVFSLVLHADELNKDLVEHYTDQKLVWNYFNTLDSIIMFAKQRGYKLLLQPVLEKKIIDPFDDEFFKTHKAIRKEWRVLPLIRHIWSEVELLIVSNKTSLFTIQDRLNLPRCGYNHPCEKIHELFAQELLDDMKEKLCS